MSFRLFREMENSVGGVCSVLWDGFRFIVGKIPSIRLFFLVCFSNWGFRFRKSFWIGKLA